MRLYDTDNTDNPYTRIGLRSFINCCGTRTIHGGTLMIPEVKQAMVEASNYFVNIDELMEAVGRRLAELTGAEWGIVTSGAAAALYSATAACVAGTDPEKMLSLPNTAGLKDRVIMLKGGRFAYDHAIRMVGVEIIEVETREELLERLDEQVAMVALLGTHLARAESALRLEDIVEVTQPVGVPILMDAASEHLKHPNPYLTRGATMVAYSGGKYLRGPQCSGLLLGEKEWVKAAWINAAPHHTLGRAMKTGKEEIMGLLAAVEYWATERDREAETKRWESDLVEIAEEVTHLSTVTTEFLQPETPNAPVPRLAIRWDGDRIGLTGLELRDRLLEGEPRIMLDDRGATDTSIFILPFSLEPGEAKVVGSRIREVLEGAPKPRKEAVLEPVQVEGPWDLEIKYAKGTSSHSVVLKQRAQELSGLHRTLFHENALSGQVVENRITFSSLHKFEGTHISYRFTGSVDRDVMGGTVEVGQAGQSAHGPLNQQEFGKGTWQARRQI
jgi:L-seryl-tRNA(Ser) seleniumtransferase